MERDYIVEEVHETRRKIENMCFNDRDKYIAYLHEIEALNKDRLIRREPVSALRYAKVAEEYVAYK